MKKEQVENYRWEDRAMSWSQISLFEWDPEKWYQKYYLNIKDPETSEMKFGKVIGKRLETDPTFLPMIPRHSKMEHEFKCPFKGIPAGLVGYADSFCLITNKKLAEYKTGKRPWTQERANEHGQITMYLLMHYIVSKIRPEDVESTLIWMPTRDNGDFSISFVEPIEKHIKFFLTKRTMMDILQFGKRINVVYKQMQEYIKIKEFNR